MPLRRILAVLVLAALTSLSPALAQPHPARAERTAVQAHPTSFIDLFLEGIAETWTRLLGGTKDSGASPGPDGAKTDGGSGLDPDGSK
jgi:hypothetical protein